jgi:hypothetical protein
MAGMAMVAGLQGPLPNTLQWGELNWKYQLFSSNATATSLGAYPTLASPVLHSTYAAWNQTLITSSTTSTAFIIDLAAESHLTPELIWTHYNCTYELTAEQKAARARREEERQAQLAVRERERAAADELAGKLLLACLDENQARDHLELGWFDVISSRGRRFRIFTRTSVRGQGSRPSQAGNVVLLSGQGQQEARYCVHPPDGLPHADAWLAQKLALEADEDTVLAVANMPWRREGHVDIRPDARRRLQLAA